MLDDQLRAVRGQHTRLADPRRRSLGRRGRAGAGRARARSTTSRPGSPPRTPACATRWPGTARPATSSAPPVSAAVRHQTDLESRLELHRTRAAAAARPHRRGPGRDRLRRRRCAAAAPAADSRRPGRRRAGARAARPGERDLASTQRAADDAASGRASSRRGRARRPGSRTRADGAGRRVARVDEALRAARALADDPDHRAAAGSSPGPTSTLLRRARRTPSPGTRRRTPDHDEACAPRRPAHAPWPAASTAALAAWAPVRAELELTADLALLRRGQAPDNAFQMRLSAYVLAHRLGAGRRGRQPAAGADERPALLPRPHRPARRRRDPRRPQPARPRRLVGRGPRPGHAVGRRDLRRLARPGARAWPT